jgi:hypothetical protein
MSARMCNKDHTKVLLQGSRYIFTLDQPNDAAGFPPAAMTHGPEQAIFAEFAHAVRVLDVRPAGVLTLEHVASAANFALVAAHA